MRSYLCMAVSGMGIPAPMAICPRLIGIIGVLSFIKTSCGIGQIGGNWFALVGECSSSGSANCAGRRGLRRG